MLEPLFELIAALYDMFKQKNGLAVLAIAASVFAFVAFVAWVFVLR